MDEIDLIKEKLKLIESGYEESILLINYNNLGDLICDTPSIRNIRKRYQKEKIILLVRNQCCVELMNNCPYIDEVIEMPHSKDSLEVYYEFCKKLKKYAFILSVQFVRPFNEFNRTYIPYMLDIKKRLGLIQKDYKAKYEKAFTEYVELFNNTTRTEESLELLKLLNIKIDNEKTECWINNQNIMHFKYDNYIIIQTCATMESRMWHHSNFITLIKLILNKYSDIKILLTGTMNEYDKIKHIHDEIDNDRVIIMTDINIDTLLNYIKNARLLITNDTGPFHFATAFNIKRIVMFGISPKEYLIRSKTENCIAICGTNKCPKDCNIRQLTSSNCIETYKMFGDNYNCINTINPHLVFKFTKFILEEKNEK